MHPSSDTPERDPELANFESLLRQLVPAPSQRDERELFYQAGYAAKHGEIPNLQRGSWGSVSRGSILGSFSGGIAAGIAATWLLWGTFGYRGTDRPPFGPAEVDANRMMVVEIERAPDDIPAARASERAKELTYRTERSDLAWNEKEIRQVIYRGNRRAIWNSYDDNAAEGVSYPIQRETQVTTESQIEMDNLNWRRLTDEEWLD